jgi:acyl-coenzyme A synthetase/AMP-(fatty) acid ligase
LEHDDECAEDVAVNLLQAKLDLHSASKESGGLYPHVINPQDHWFLAHGSNLICQHGHGLDYGYHPPPGIMHMSLMQPSLSERSLRNANGTDDITYLLAGNESALLSASVFEANAWNAFLDHDSAYYLGVGQFVFPLLAIALWMCYRDARKASLLEAPQVQVSAKGNDVPAAPQEGFMSGPPLGDLFAAGSITALLDRRVGERPDAIAVVDAQTSTTLSYAQLQQKVWDLSSALGQKLRKGDVLVLLFQTSVPLMVSVLAAMRAEIVWVPLDELAPAARLQLQIERCGAQLGLAFEESEARDKIGSLLPTYLLTSQGAVTMNASLRTPRSSRGHEVSQQQLPREIASREIAAMIFTSGSTGVPKAVLYAQSTLLHGVLSCVDLCRMDSSTRLLVKTPSVWAVIEYELFSALVVGGTAVIDPTCQRDIRRLSKVVVEQRISALVTSAPVLQLMASELQGKQHDLHDIINVGAAMPVDVCFDALESLGTHVRVHNMYGCTETPCTSWTFSTQRNKDVPLPKLAPAGRPQPGCDVYLLDENLRPVPAGCLGEICFGGNFLSPGYFRDVEQTTKRFVPNPHGKGKLYCSGDLGRFVLDPLQSSSSSPWVLQVEGRKDRQLNINGIRVAPEEVEALIAKAPGVVECAVVQAGDGESAQMVACVSGATPQKDGVSKYCEETLAKHMRPSCVLVFPALPKLSNGKVDLKTLERNATDACQKNGSKEVVDSLGLMRKMSTNDLQQKRITDNLVAVSVIGMVFFHTCQTAWSCWELTDKSHYGSAFENSVLYWSVIAWRETSEWSSYGFVIGGALMDAVDPNRFKVGLREAVIVFAFLVGCGVHRVLVWEWAGSSFWYLVMLLFAKTILVIGHRFHIPRLQQLLIFMSCLNLGSVATALDIYCEDGPYDSIGWHQTNFLCEMQGNLFGLKSMLKMGKTCCLVIYGFTFLYGADLAKDLRSLRRHAPSSPYTIHNMAMSGFAIFAFMVISGAWRCFHDFYFQAFGRLVSVVVLLPLLFALLLLPEEVHFETVARTALGSYVSSCIFYGTYLWRVQTFFWIWVGNVGGPVWQLIGMIVVVCIWVYFIGPASQALLLAPIKSATEALEQLIPSRRGSSKC